MNSYYALQLIELDTKKTVRTHARTLKGAEWE